MDEGMMQGGAPRSMRSPGFAARGFLRHEAEFPGSQTSLAADAPAITFQRSKSISNLEVFDTGGLPLHAIGRLTPAWACRRHRFGLAAKPGGKSVKVQDQEAGGLQ